MRSYQNTRSSSTAHQLIVSTALAADSVELDWKEDPMVFENEEPDVFMIEGDGAIAAVARCFHVLWGQLYRSGMRSS
jgi:hypothetical protein